MYDVVVIGGGPAGMMSAIFASENGANVLLIEKNSRLGTKLLATGNGRCNISNRNISRDRYHGTFSEGFDAIYRQFDLKSTTDFFREIGVDFKEENSGRLFPTTDKASSVLNALEKKLTDNNVHILVNTVVTDLRHTDFWQVVISDSVTECKKVIVTTGGKAAHKLGSSGDGLFWSTKLRHTPTKLYAALVPLETEESYVSEAMGVKMTVKAAALVDGKVVAIRSGDMLFTHYGVSGPAVMGLSGYIAPYVDNRSVHLEINLLPEMTIQEIDSWLVAKLLDSPKKKVATILEEKIPSKLAKIFAKELLLEHKNASEVSKNDRKQIVETLSSLSLTVTKVRPLKEAQVTSGGINFLEVNERLESRYNSGLYFAGEILDIDGDSGGFNLQWAWSSGYVAGKETGGGNK
jgi:predicted Rossmann fold flavoprotein